MTRKWVDANTYTNEYIYVLEIAVDPNTAPSVKAEWAKRLLWKVQQNPPPNTIEGKMVRALTRIIEENT
jgi:hypothetical protein